LNIRHIGITTMRFARLALPAIFVSALSLSACGNGGVVGNTAYEEKGTLMAEPVSDVETALVVHVMNPWLRPPSGETGIAAGYMALHGMGGDNALIAASSPLAERVEIHTHEMNAEGMMRMFEVARVELPDNAMVTLAPGGYHLMLFGVTVAPAMGTSVPITLTFEKGDQVTVDALVRMPTAQDLEAASNKHDAIRSGHDGH
jgi:periplasmic copper chaperone A